MPRGNPVYTDALADRICDELMSGKSLVKICDVKGMPHRVTVIRWMEKDPDFATRCARARNSQADMMDDFILDAAKRTLDGDLDPQAAKVAISAFQWRASKLAPKKYGDKTELAVTGPDGKPVQSVSVVVSDPIEAAKAYQKLMSGE